MENSNYSFNLVCRFKSFNLIRRTVCQNTCIGMNRMWCFILSKCAILRLTPAHVHVYVHFSKDFCLCIPYFTTYLHVGVIRRKGKYPACMYSVNLYLSGLGRLHIICESTLQCTPLGDLDNVF